VSFVSQYNQIKASSDVKGIEIIIAAKNDDFLAISETITMIIALINVLNIKYIFLYDHLLYNK
tara:strand:- start:39 stop:227 length:189 start_codon:yes stop_codon:yes gene_type:complete